MATKVILPVLGETMNEGTVVEWFKREGEAVRRGEPLFAVETDKTTLEVEATTDGYLRRILAPAGTTVPVLTPIGIITATPDEQVEGQVDKETGESLVSSDKVRPSFVEEAAVVQLVTESVQSTPAPAGRVFASPRARRRAGELGVDLGRVQGSGPGGRIVERDVLSFVEKQPKATPVAAKMAAEMGIDLREVSGSGIAGKVTKADVERAAQPVPVPEVTPLPQPAPVPTVKLPAVEIGATQPLSGLRGIIAGRMAASAHTVARVTLFSEVDATALVEVREQLKKAVSQEWGFAPGYNDLLAIIVARALCEFPYMNARLNGDTVEHLAKINMGMAVDTERGLLVVVIRDADQKGLRRLGTEFRTLVERARVGKSLPDDLSGGTFTITNLGMYGVDAFTPIINLPEAAILGVGRIVDKPVVRNGQVVVRSMLTLSLAFDHRLIDGAPAARFLQRIAQLIEQPYLLLG